MAPRLQSLRAGGAHMPRGRRAASPGRRSAPGRRSTAAARPPLGCPGNLCLRVLAWGRHARHQRYVCRHFGRVPPRRILARPIWPPFLAAETQLDALHAEEVARWACGLLQMSKSGQHFSTRSGSNIGRRLYLGILPATFIPVLLGFGHVHHRCGRVRPPNLATLWPHSVDIAQLCWNPAKFACLKPGLAEVMRPESLTLPQNPCSLCQIRGD